MIDKGIFMLLAADPATAAIVGNRIYWILQPKGTAVPSIVLDVVTTNDLYESAGCTGLREMVLQVDGYAADHYSSRSITRAARLLFENFIGNLPDADATEVIAAIISKDWTMPYEAGGKGFVFRSLLEVRLRYYDTSLPVSTPSNPLAIIDGGTSTINDTGNVTEAVISGGTS